MYCGSHDKLTIDHVMPISRGGKSSFKNCVTCCVKCNLKKGNKTIEEAQMRLREAPHEPNIIEFLTHKMKNTGIYKFLKDLKVY
jgi:5-methylcytosine-specific restriction endonuclease McrA